MQFGSKTECHFYQAEYFKLQNGAGLSHCYLPLNLIMYPVGSENQIVEFSAH